MYFIILLSGEKLQYTYKDYKLYKIEPNFNGIGKKPMYFFSKKIPKRGEPSGMPQGYKMEVNKKTGMPYLRYSGNRISLHQRKKKELR